MRLYNGPWMSPIILAAANSPVFNAWQDTESLFVPKQSDRRPSAVNTPEVSRQGAFASRRSDEQHAATKTFRDVTARLFRIPLHVTPRLAMRVSSLPRADCIILVTICRSTHRLSKKASLGQRKKNALIFHARNTTKLRKLARGKPRVRKRHSRGKDSATKQ